MLHRGASTLILEGLARMPRAQQVELFQALGKRPAGSEPASELGGLLRRVDDLKPDKVNFNYIRPPSADPKELDIDHSRYAKLAQMIDDDSRHAVVKNNYGGEAGFFKAAIDIYMHGLIAKTQETQTAQMTCYAGTAGGVIYDEGTVSSCENLDAIGNLRDFDWNFQKLWLSPAMKERRKKAADGCFCTHESNSYYPSLPFNPKHLIQIKKLEREMKKARKLIDTAQPQPEGVTIQGY